LETFFLFDFSGLRNKDEATGSHVKPKIIAPIMAKKKDNAMG
jgi:hypothetical protein